jgi:serine/threonine-protein kinase HipA
MAKLYFSSGTDAKKMARLRERGELYRIRRGIYIDTDDPDETKRTLDEKWPDIARYLYGARRFDRGPKGEKYHQEDFCQILGRESYRKYDGSIEQIGKALKQHSDLPGDNLYRLLEIIVFNFLIGNVDAHLKNFSISYETPKGINKLLSPGYDLLSTDLYIDNDKEESALAINGKKNNLRKKDFQQLAKHFDIDDKILIKLIEKFESLIPSWQELIMKSFLVDEKKLEFIQLIDQRIGRLT